MYFFSGCSSLSAFSNLHQPRLAQVEIPRSSVRSGFSTGGAKTKKNSLLAMWKAGGKLLSHIGSVCENFKKHGFKLKKTGFQDTPWIFPGFGRTRYVYTNIRCINQGFWHYSPGNVCWDALQRLVDRLVQIWNWPLQIVNLRAREEVVPNEQRPRPKLCNRDAFDPSEWMH